MRKEEILQKIKSVLLCLSAHPDNEQGSEFEDRIEDLIEIEAYLLTENSLKKYDEDDMRAVAETFDRDWQTFDRWLINYNLPI